MTTAAETLDRARAERVQAALDLANRIRRTNAADRKLIRQLPRPDGLRAAAAVIADPTPTQARMPLEQLLGACHRVGPAAITRVAVAMQASSNRRLGDLTDRQRRVAVARLEALAAGPNQRTETTGSSAGPHDDRSTS